MRSLAGKLRIPSPDQALPGRAERMPVAPRHHVLDTPLEPPFPDGMQTALFGMGCFWGAEQKFWEAEGVYSTAVGYAAGLTPNPSYDEVCSGYTGHNEVVRVVFDPARVPYDVLLRIFFENHDPTQGMQQGNDVGTQYRSGIYVASPEQRNAAESSRDAYQAGLTRAGPGWGAAHANMASPHPSKRSLFAVRTSSILVTFKFCGLQGKQPSRASRRTADRSSGRGSSPSSAGRVVCGDSGPGQN